MSDTSAPEHNREFSREEELSALFAQMVLQQSNMAMMLLGKVPHPQTGQTMQDIEAARMFIDQLEMIDARTKGNLSKDEDALLKHTLMTLRLSFVEAVESKDKQPARTEPQPAAPAAPASDASSSSEEESKKKFSKKY
jgi:hypothetical protein